MDKIETPTTLVIIGISGDLSRRKLLPAIREIARAGVLPGEFRIVGVSRRDLSLDDVLPASGDNSYLSEHLTLRQMDLDDPGAYSELGEYLNSLESDNGPCQRLFYLSVPPKASQDIVEHLGQSGLAKKEGAKLLLEKPFGTDLTSAQALIDHIHGHFDESQVYRIDHYLAKEMAQNLVVFRSGNSLFKRTWNKDFIESINITMTEQIGIEGRSAFYEQTGALRDIIQSHLLQLAALVLMDLPTDKDDWSLVPAQRLQALRQLRPPEDVKAQVVRGQYRSYKEEVDNPDSSTETFVSLEVRSEDPKWSGVPIRLTTGKAMSEAVTEIKICYRRDDVSEANTLVLRVQPDEGVELTLWAKQPGYGYRLQTVPLNFLYSDHFSGLPEAYERVFVDAMRSDHSLFASSDEVLASWQILKPIQDNWADGDLSDMRIYESRASIEEVLGEQT